MISEPPSWRISLSLLLSIVRMLSIKSKVIEAATKQSEIDYKFFKNFKNEDEEWDSWKRHTLIWMKPGNTIYYSSVKLLKLIILEYSDCLSLVNREVLCKLRVPMTSRLHTRKSTFLVNLRSLSEIFSHLSLSLS